MTPVTEITSFSTAGSDMPLTSPTALLSALLLPTGLAGSGAGCRRRRRRPCRSSVLLRPAGRRTVRMPRSARFLP